MSDRAIKGGWRKGQKTFTSNLMINARNVLHHGHWGVNCTRIYTKKPTIVQRYRLSQASVTGPQHEKASVNLSLSLQTDIFTCPQQPHPLTFQSLFIAIEKTKHTGGPLSTKMLLFSLLCSVLYYCMLDTSLLQAAHSAPIWAYPPINLPAEGWGKVNEHSGWNSKIKTISSKMLNGYRKEQSANLPSIQMHSHSCCGFFLRSPDVLP